MLLPFWLALSASVALHIGILLAPGWDLPFDGEPEGAHIEATLVTATTAAPVPKPALPIPRPAVKKRVAAKPPPVPTPDKPVATVPVESEPVEPVLADAASDTRAEPAPAPKEAQSPADLPAPTFAKFWPRAGRIVYQVTRGEQGFIVGQSEQRWEHDGMRYQLRAVTETTGLAALFRPAKVVMESRGRFDAAGLRPLEFEVLREGRGRDSVRFDPDQGRISIAGGKSAPFVVAAQDQLSLFHQLAALGFDLPEFPLTVATGRSVTSHAVIVGAELALDTSQGPRQVRHLKLGGRPGEDVTEVWLDVETRLPLKIRHRDRKGDVFDQIAITIETESIK